MQKLPNESNVTYYIRHYFHPRVLSMLFFGVAAGAPYLLITSTFYQWLLEEGISQSTITRFAWCTLPLTIKFFWSHWVDHLKVPILHRFGQYRSWLLFSQIGVLLSLFILSQVVAVDSLLVTGVVVTLVSFFTASQDIALGAYRVTILSKEQQAFGSSHIVIGYRIGILLSGGVALYLSTFMRWQSVYLILALLQVQGMLTVLFNPEPRATKNRRHKIKSYQLNRVLQVLYREFFSRASAGVFLLYIFLFKFGDATLNTFTWIFLRKVGFTKEEISLSVAAGFVATAVAAALAGSIIDAFKIRKSLVVTAILQMLVFLTLWIQAAYPKDHTLMLTTIMLENFVCGFASACIYTLFAYKVSKRFSATQYTFFASFASLSKVIIASLGGFVLDFVSWQAFFAAMFIAPMLSFFIIYRIKLNPQDG